MEKGTRSSSFPLLEAGKIAERLPVFLLCSWLLLQVSMTAAAVCAPSLPPSRAEGR